MRNVRGVQRDAARLWRLCHLEGQLDEKRARIVCDRLTDGDHPVAPEIVASFRRLLRRETARHVARVESAVRLDSIVCEAIDRVLVHRYGEAIRTTFAVDPWLIGGLRITVGSDVFDDSVRARLDALDARFADVAAPRREN